MVFHGISIISAPHNMGVDILFVQLSSLLTDIWPTNEFSVMAALICIKNVRGTFCQLVNIANRFLRIFSNLETLIRFIFPGGAGYPYLPTQLAAGSTRTNDFIDNSRPCDHNRKLCGSSHITPKFVTYVIIIWRHVVIIIRRNIHLLKICYMYVY